MKNYIKPKPKRDWTSIMVQIGLWGMAILLTVAYIK